MMYSSDRVTMGNLSRKKIYCATRGHLDKDATRKTDPLNDFTSVFHRNTFRVDVPITLVGLSFFGPLLDNGTQFADYRVEYEIVPRVRQSKYCCLFFKNGQQDHIFGDGRVGIHAKGNEKFYVSLGNVNIPANIFVEIAFVLEGPPTGRLKDPAQQACTVQTGKRAIKFDFFSGSRQMPDLYFTMQEDK